VYFILGYPNFIEIIELFVMASEKMRKNTVLLAKGNMQLQQFL
jgi:hypothetical protein